MFTPEYPFKVSLCEKCTRHHRVYFLLPCKKPQKTWNNCYYWLSVWSDSGPHNLWRIKRSGLTVDQFLGRPKPPYSRLSGAVGVFPRDPLLAIRVIIGSIYSAVLIHRLCRRTFAFSDAAACLIPLDPSPSFCFPVLFPPASRRG